MILDTLANIIAITLVLLITLSMQCHFFGEAKPTVSFGAAIGDHERINGIALSLQNVFYSISPIENSHRPWHQTDGSKYSGTNGATFGSTGDPLFVLPDQKLPVSNVYYNANGGTGTLIIEQGVQAGLAFTVKFAPLPTRAGFTFLGWDRNPVAERPEFTQTGLSTFLMGNENVTLYAVWMEENQPGQTSGSTPASLDTAANLEVQLPSFTIKYDANKGAGSVPEPQAALQGSSVPVAFSPQPTREGFVFLGWSTAQNSSTAHYMKNGAATLEVRNADTTLFAVWEIATPVFGDPPIKAMMMVNGTIPPENSSFKLVLEAQTKNAPMPFGSVGNKKTITTKANKVIEFGNISFIETGKYSYSVYALAGTQHGFENDNNIYTITYEINSKLECKRTVAGKESSQDSGAIVFVGRYAFSNNKDTYINSRRLWGKSLFQRKQIASQPALQKPPFTKRDLLVILVPVFILGSVFASTKSNKIFKKQKKLDIPAP
ncbi:MAG: InlB B-repeat-containing protein [Eubacteriaceae bacterium]|nr:InlB B-repeat-containing protein [Eubacteriaceae bacterium]